MKRKISAILAADIAGYSNLLAQDEEETLRRLAIYRAVLADFVARWGGRIFNTAGDAVLAEFPSSVDVVRCAVDFQESIRAHNLAYPPSRRMLYRIGITVADVVERDGDVLGDGVTIAARLGGIATRAASACHGRSTSRSQALSVKFDDLGQQQVKNVPNPVHAYSIAPCTRLLSVRWDEVRKSPRQDAGRRLAAPAMLGVVAVGPRSRFIRRLRNFFRRPHLRW